MHHPTFIKFAAAGMLVDVSTGGHYALIDRAPMRSASTPHNVRNRYQIISNDNEQTLIKLFRSLEEALSWLK